METVTVRGKVYQIGAIYYAAGDYLELVSAEDGEFILTGPDCGSIDVATNKIKVVDQFLGTITDEPIELEDGEWYMCESEIVRRYNKSTGFIDGAFMAAVKPLYKMVRERT